MASTVSVSKVNLVWYRRLLALWLLLVWVSIPASSTESAIVTLRSNSVLGQPKAPEMTPIENQDVKRQRIYPEQAPTIPHDIRNYQIDLNFNQCLACHDRKNVARSQAPMVSVTHFMGRNGQIGAFVSPRRYVCTQCHVPQHEVKPLFENTFIDVDTLYQNKDASIK